VEGGGEVSEGVVPRHARASALAFFGVVATTVEYLPADFTALLPVLTHSPFRTNWQPKPIPQHHEEVLVRHQFHRFVFERDWRFQEPSSTWATEGAQVNSVIRRETL